MLMTVLGMGLSEMDYAVLHRRWKLLLVAVPGNKKAHDGANTVVGCFAGLPMASLPVEAKVRVAMERLSSSKTSTEEKKSQGVKC
jgi:hypothetical protein